MILENKLNITETDEINNREVYMKGIDNSYSYEGYTSFRTDELQIDGAIREIKEYEYVLIAQGEDIRSLLDENGIEYYLAFPSIDSKSEYVRRYRERGNNEAFVNLVEANFEQWVEDLQRCPQRKIMIRPGQNLESEMINLGLIEKQNEVDYDER